MLDAHMRGASARFMDFLMSCPAEDLLLYAGYYSSREEEEHTGGRVLCGYVVSGHAGLRHLPGVRTPICD